MFAGDRAPQTYREVHDFAEGRVRVSPHGRVSGIEDDERMGISVAGMRNQRDCDAVLGGDRLDARDELG